MSFNTALTVNGIAVTPATSALRSVIALVVTHRQIFMYSMELMLGDVAAENIDSGAAPQRSYMISTTGIGCHWCYRW